MSNCEHLVSLSRNNFLQKSVETGALKCSDNQFCDWRIPYLIEDIKGQNIGCNIFECPKVRSKNKAA